MKLIASSLSFILLTSQLVTADTGLVRPAAYKGESTSHSISYDFFEAGYIHTFSDNTPFDIMEGMDGYGINLAASLGDIVTFSAGVSQVFSSDSVDLPALGLSGTVDSNALGLSAGVGFHLPINNRIDWVFGVAGTYARLNSDGSGTIDGVYGETDGALLTDGFGVTGTTGLRMSLASFLELNVFYNHAWSHQQTELFGFDLGSDDVNANFASVSLVFKNIAVEKLDFVVGGLYSEDAQSLSASVRYNF
jgi:hypothetical protein